MTHMKKVKMIGKGQTLETQNIKKQMKSQVIEMISDLIKEFEEMK